MRTAFVLLACSITSTHGASAALANITLVSDAREIFAFSSATNATQTRTDGPDLLVASFGTLFDDNVATAISVVGAGASASAVQTSEITPGLIEVLGSASASGTVSSGISSRGESRSIVDLVFDVAGGSAIQILASISGTGVFELRSAFTNEIIFSGDGIFDRVAPVGGERLRLIARGTALVTPPPSGSDGGGYSVRFTAIPAPGAAALLAGGVMMSTRRRRT
jgi:hypothetical protein